MGPATERVSFGAAPEAGTDRERAGEALGRAFKGAIAAVRRLRGRDTQRPGEIAHAQYALLVELAQRGELPAGELAAAADVTPATVSGMLDHLAEAGLVARSRSERDRRIVVCRLTPAGVERVAARHARLTPLWNAALAEFDAEELRTATAVLERVRALFEALGAECGEAARSPSDPGSVEPGHGRR
ncbi:MAG TPA: MarR family transcriptional regulator [Solirubrobacteraceae bacterium]|nr:MarR family transcriptional regulator [Solirubrobacteraceae bacterium]